jgi:hypothetical protein
VFVRFFCTRSSIRLMVDLQSNLACLNGKTNNFSMWRILLMGLTQKLLSPNQFIQEMNMIV